MRTETGTLPSLSLVAVLERTCWPPAASVTVQRSVPFRLPERSSIVTCPSQHHDARVVARDDRRVDPQRRVQDRGRSLCPPSARSD
ncbi:MAG: hypothetical protein MZV65_53080 [Chromatiales bacterium]|nr:hypothetical protein [Chromatiales bacterium]